MTIKQNYSKLTLFPLGKQVNKNMTVIANIEIDRDLFELGYLVPHLQERKPKRKPIRINIYANDTKENIEKRLRKKFKCTSEM